MKKSKVTRSLLAAMSIVALTAVMYGCTHSSDDPPASGGDMMEEPDPAIAERASINSAVMAAETAAAGINNDSTGSEVSSADSAIANARSAIAAAQHIPSAELAAQTARVNAAANRLNAAKMARQEAIDNATTQAAKDNAKLGKAMHAALGGTTAENSTALNNITATNGVLADTDLSNGLTIDAVSGAGALPDGTGGTTAVDPASVDLEAGASAGSLDGWMGTDYAHADKTTKIKNEARVYTNPDPAKSMSFTEKYGDASEYTAATRTYNVGTSADSKIKSSSFPTVGAKTFTGAQDISGTYDGAPGQYKCASACTATFTATGIQLSENWTFVHASGAQVSTPDANYLYFGWWVSKDKDGMPTAASAFRGVVGDVDGETGTTDPVSINGSATYAGAAVGKFAMSNPLDGTGSAGHFTADAMLTAKFGSTDAPNNGGVTGTIDNFRLNDGSSDPGWSVELKRGAWGSGGAISAPAGNDANKGTVWTINGNPAPASGTWSGQVYDELPGNAAPAGDGSNVPTTVTGTFYSEFSTIGRMVGAFGAEKQ